jgi:glycerophosphoryl diester phosphodiesterase
MNPTANPWLERRVLAYAHQGGAKEAPSSTLFAIARAREAGVGGIELDVHATADGVPVVCHDPSVDRTTNGSGEIRHHRLAELLELDNAYWFVPGEDTPHDRPPGDYPLRGRAPAERDLRIATLDEALEATRGLVVNLDIKRTAPAVEPYEHLVAAAIRRHGREGDVIVASFDDRATDAFARIAPDIATSAGTAAVAELYQSLHAGGTVPESILRHAAVQVPPSVEGHVIVDDLFVEALHEAGIAVHVWTIDEPEEMERLVALGVDGIISDRPSVLVAVLERLGVAWRPGADPSGLSSGRTGAAPPAGPPSR